MQNPIVNKNNFFECSTNLKQNIIKVLTCIIDHPFTTISSVNAYLINVDKIRLFMISMTAISCAFILSILVLKPTHYNVFLSFTFSICLIVSKLSVFLGVFASNSSILRVAFNKINSQVYYYAVLIDLCFIGVFIYYSGRYLYDKFNFLQSYKLIFRAFMFPVVFSLFNMLSFSSFNKTAAVLFQTIVALMLTHLLFSDNINYVNFFKKNSSDDRPDFLTQQEETNNNTALYNDVAEETHLNSSFFSTDSEQTVYQDAKDEITEEDTGFFSRFFTKKKG